VRTKVEQTTCDFCGYGGWLSRPEDFTTTGDVDLCRWCAGAPTAQGVMACGEHEVTIGADTWTCTCGEVYVRPIFTPFRVLAALPSVVGATASVHVNR
jgi:hypothetical protein